MAQRLTSEEVRKVAQLARLSLSDAEVERFTRQLGDVLEHVARLQALDVSAVPPTSHAVPLAAPERPDEVGGSLTREAALAIAPATEDGAFRVPKIVEG